MSAATDSKRAIHATMLLLLKLRIPFPSFEFKFVGGFLIAADKVLRLTLAHGVGLERVTVVALGKEYPAQKFVPHFEAELPTRDEGGEP